MLNLNYFQRSLSLIFCIGFFSLQLFSQNFAYKHITSASNTSGHITTLDHPDINNNPNAVLFVTHDYQRGPYLKTTIGVYYQGGKWRIFNQDKSRLATGIAFNVMKTLVTGSNIIRHTASRSNTSGHITTIDHPAFNNNPNLKILVTQYWTGTYNNNEIGVWYSGGKWKIFNQNKNALPSGSSFNVMIIDQGIKHIASSGPTSYAHVSKLSGRGTTTRDKLVFVTPVWEGSYNTATVGVWYSGGSWNIYNEDRTALPPNAKFFINVMDASPVEEVTDESDELRIPKALITTVANGILNDMEIRMHNFGPRRRDSNNDVVWEVMGQSSIMLNGITTPLGIREFTRGVRDKKYYVNDINLQRARTRFEGSQIILKLTFEESGTDLKGMCSNCARFREDNGAPDFDFDDHSWDIVMNLIPFRGSIAFEVVDVRFLGDLEGPGFGLRAEIAENNLIPIMSSQISVAMNGARSIISDQIRTAANDAGIDLSSVRNIQVEGNDIIIVR